MPTTIILGPRIINHLTVPRVDELCLIFDDSMRDEDIFVKSQQNTSRIRLTDFCTHLEMHFKNNLSYIPAQVSLICNSDTANLVFEKIDAWCYEYKEGYKTMSNEEFLSMFKV